MEVMNKKRKKRLIIKRRRKRKKEIQELILKHKVEKTNDLEHKDIQNGRNYEKETEEIEYKIKQTKKRKRPS
jgi:hypothetical protein